MTKIAQEVSATSSFTRTTASYDSTKWNLGTLINQFTSTDGTFIGPNTVAVARPFEESTAVAVRFPTIIPVSPTIDWVFLVEAANGPGERVFLYEYDKVRSKYNWCGFVTCNLNTGATHTMRGFQVARYLHSTGTIQVSGSSVVGSGTNFVSERIAAGARIAYGVTDPNAATAWYPISSIASDTLLTVSMSTATASYSSYVIDELRPIFVTSNNTTTNGGVFVCKGINYDTFTTSGTTISASVSTADNQRLVYWLANAASVTNIAGAGMALENYTSFTTHSAYVPDTSGRIFKYNLRASGSIASGKMVLSAVNGDMVTTGVQALTGTLSQVNNGVLATTSHGPGSGSRCLYFVTGTRLYRAAVANVTAGNSAWVSDNRTEVPPGGVNTFAATGVLSSINYSSVIDRFVVLSTGATAFRHYITTYPTTSGDQWSHIFGLDTKQLDQGTADNSTIPRFDGNTTAVSGDFGSGVLHIVKMGASALASQLYALPIGAHWTYGASTGNRAITPAISTPNCNKMYRAYVLASEYITAANGNLTEVSYVPAEPYRLYYRTSGITDNSGAWTLIPKTGDISGVGAVSSIQFMLDFKTVGNGFLLPAQIFYVGVIYDDMSTDSHYQPSVGNSSTASKAFSWRHCTAFGGTVPNLRVRLYDAVSAGLLVDDTSAASGSGAWSKSTNGGSSWGAFDNTDKANETTYVRYVPTSLADNATVRALLTLN